MPRRRWTSSTVVTRDGATLAVRGGGGADRPAVVLLTGLGTPQQAWNRVARRLVPDYRVITFDYRGHARSGPAPSYDLESFLDDVSSVLRACQVENPVLCGWSLGADLAVWHAARHPRSSAGLVLLDGGIPAEPTVLDDERARREMNGVLARITGRLARAMKAGVHLSTEQLLAVAKDVDAWRTRVLTAYATLTCPVVVALGERTGASADPELSAAWREGAARLAADHPSVPVHWLDSDHAIPLRRPAQVAELIDSVAARTGAR